MYVLRSQYSSTSNNGIELYVRWQTEVLYDLSNDVMHGSSVVTACTPTLAQEGVEQCSNKLKPNMS